MPTTHGGRGQAAAGTPRGRSCGFRSQGASASSPFSCCELPVDAGVEENFPSKRPQGFPQLFPQPKALAIMVLLLVVWVFPRHYGYGFIYI